MARNPHRRLRAHRWKAGFAIIVVLASVYFSVPISAQKTPRQPTHVYTLTYKRAVDVEKTLSELLANYGDKVQIFANRRKNQILVRGPKKAHEIVRQLLAETDKPARKPKPQPVKSVFQKYPVDKLELNKTLAALKEHFKGRDDVLFASDVKLSRILVFASPAVHREIQKRFGLKTSPKTSLPDTKSPSVFPIPRDEYSRRTTGTRASRFSSGSEGTAIKQRSMNLAHSELAWVEKTLARLFNTRFQALEKTQADLNSFLLIDSGGRRIHLSTDYRTRQIHVEGSARLVDQVIRLVEALDSPPQPLGRKMRFIPVRNADPRTVQKVFEAYRQSTRARKTYKLPKAKKQNSKEPFLDNNQSSFNQFLKDSQFQPASYQTPATRTQLPGQKTPPLGQKVQPKNKQRPIDLDRQRQMLQQLGLDVEIEVLPDLDVIIIRGPEQDVQEATRIIQEIERLSEESQAEIEIVKLRNVENGALANLINGAVSQALTGTRQGRVTVIPLGKPNALLLIGWGEAVNAIKELIAKLDVPVPPETQLRVFSLRNSSASQARTTITQFLQNRPGLGTRARLTADRRTNSLFVQASPRDMLEVAAMIEQIDHPQGSPFKKQVRPFRLKNSLANDISQTLQNAINAARGQGNGAPDALVELITIDPNGAKILKSGMLDFVQITPDPRTNTILVTAPEKSMDLIAALIDYLDSAPAATSQIKVFRIMNGDAARMVTLLRALLPTQTGGTIRPQLSSAPAETSMAPLRLAVDTRTNSIIATGSRGDLQIIEVLLLRLDEKEIQQRENLVYRLKNSPANDVATAVNSFLRSERQLQQAAPGTESPFQQLEREVVVVPEPISNSLIISATPRFFKEIVDLVEKLDDQPPQVMIQVMIVEIDLTNTDEFGVELGLQDSLLFDRSLLSNLITTTSTGQTSTVSGVVTQTDQIIQAADNTPGFQFNSREIGNSGSRDSIATAEKLAPQGLTNFGVGRINSELGFGGLVLSAGNESINILLRSLQESRRIEVLSRPQIMTLDNQPAFIQIGQRVPRITGTQINQVGQVNNITLENVGLILGVTPRISSDGMVVMEVDAEKSEVGNDQDGIPLSIANDGSVIRSPITKITTAQTTISAASGDTVVLGGLIMKNTSHVNRRVPWLSDIPLLGELFQFDSMRKKRSELLIILTPHVIRSPQDAEKMKQLEMSRMSWVASDVMEIYGNRIFEETSSGIPTIYPDLNPRGRQYKGNGEPLRVPGLPKEERPLAPSELKDKKGQFNPPIFSNRKFDDREHLKNTSRSSLRPVGYRNSVPQAPAKIRIDNMPKSRPKRRLFNPFQNLFSKRKP